MHGHEKSAVVNSSEATIEASQPDEDDNELPEQMRVRRAKRERLLAEGIDPYPVGFPRTATLAQIRKQYADLPVDASTADTVAITGRVIFLRNSGKLCFATLREGDGTELQVMLSQAKIGEQELADWKALVDIGDHVGIHGEVITSKRGELSVLADRWTLTAKALRPLPVAHRPMTEQTQVRQRYVDLIVREQARQTVRLRASLVRSLRGSFHHRGFIEVETPMLQVQPGGAAARPFVTHINAYDLDLYLRIAPELYLKRCIVGGIEKVFEINRNFRNEGADSSHSPEFAMLECYEAYGDYNTMAILTRELIQEAADELFGTQILRHADGSEHDISGEWPSITLFDAVSTSIGEQITPDTSREQLVTYTEKINIQIDPLWTSGKIVEEIFEAMVVPNLITPTFVRDFPVDTAPLTREHRNTKGITEKWDLYINRVELATAYSELIDPVVQRERLVAQSRLAAKGDLEAMRLDEDFLRAIEYGMPPTGGLGMGIDRLLMTLTGLGIRETILFPLVKPE